MKKQNVSKSRRQFLRRLSYATAAVAARPGIGALESVLAQNKGGKLGIALLGLGGYAGNQLAPALQETKLCYLAGVVTGHPEKAEAWAAKYNLKRSNLYNYENLERIADNKEIVCRVKARSANTTVATTIRWIVDDGTEVQKGDKLPDVEPK